MLELDRSGYNFEPVVSKLGLGSETEAVYDFVFKPPWAEIGLKRSETRTIEAICVPSCGILFHITNDNFTAELQHANWC